jgi:hypothetical protein
MRSVARCSMAAGLLAVAIAIAGCGGRSRGGGAYSVSITPTPAAVMPGVQARLDLAVTAPSGAAVTSFAKLHTETMHLILVSQDLKDLQHVHPTLQPDGRLTVNTRLALAQPYKAFVEFEPSGSSEQLATASLEPVGAVPTNPAWDGAPVFSGTAPLDLVVDQTYVRLSTAPNAAPMIQAGMPAYVMIKVRASDRTTPANVEDYLGMGGHAIILSRDLGMFFHVHALRGGSAMNMPGMGTPGMSMPSSGSMDEVMLDPMYAGPTTDDLSYGITFPAPGVYKVFFQFQRAGRVLTAPFLVRAS